MTDNGMSASVIGSTLLGSLGRWFPQRDLLWCGLAMLLLVPAGLVWIWGDQRTIHGEAVGVKPTRFALSIGVYLLTASWMTACMRPERLGSFPVRATIWMLILGSAVELSVITLQAARGRASHFNIATAGDARIYAAMGLFAVLFIGALLPLAWEIARRPRIGAEPVMVWAIVGGLILTVMIGGGTGSYMTRIGGHAVGPGGWRIPLLGWNLGGGDIRIAHFFGIHAMQALPLIASAALLLRDSMAALTFVVGAAVYAGLPSYLFHQALRSSGGGRHALNRLSAAENLSEADFDALA